MLSGKWIKLLMIATMLVSVASTTINETATNDKCGDCEKVIAILDDGVESSITKELVEKLLDGLCEKVPSYLVNICEDAVSGITPEVIDWIVKYGITNKVCYWIHMCT